MKRLFTIVLFLISTAALAQDVRFFNKDGVAISGYDAVAYFSENAAIAGTRQFSYEWRGATWLFKNQANLDKFGVAPEKYAPQFGGYCAYGVSENHLAPTEPTAFTIVDDKLYLNYNMDVLSLWRKSMKARIEKGNDSWATLKNTLQQ